MAGPDTDAQYRLTGIRKFFISHILAGEMNYALPSNKEALNKCQLVLFYKIKHDPRKKS
uniref:Uncharacterized protein n=1 Tax=Prolemur simus TaxID=1328070 RepID=A0A8C8YZC7_PROSS